MGSRGPSVVARQGLFGLLSDGGSRGVTLLSAPAGGGKTILLRSWVEAAGLRDRVAWVTVEREEHDAQRFWLSVVSEIRAVIGAHMLVPKLGPAPTFDGDAVVERLADELGSLDQPVVLIIDDLHELRAPGALRQLQFFIERRPELLGVVIASRHDPHLGLHRLRLSGELTEIRGEDLRFSLDETRQLLAAAGVALPGVTLARLHERTEGWAAGLRLAALALAGHPDPERFVAEFSGSERTVADYLFAEVFERQPEQARRLLRRTSILDRVNGGLADLLTGGIGSVRILQELEEQNAFVFSLDVSRSWFRYHRLFADLLRLEVERFEPEAVPDLHRAAASWFETHGHVVDAVRHAQAAGDWSPAARVLADCSSSLALDGRAATVQTLLGGFPAHVVSADPELALVFAREQVMAGSLADAQAYIQSADSNARKVADNRRLAFDLSLGFTRLMVARRRGDFAGALEESQRLLAVEAPAAGAPPLSHDIRAAALTNVGIVELWANHFEEAERHLEQGLGLARLARRPYLEVQCLAHLAVADGRQSLVRARDRALQAIAIAESHGWGADRVVGPALAALGTVDVWQGRFDEAENWLERANQVVRPELEPATGLMLHLARGRLCAARGRAEDAASAFRAAAQIEALVVAPQLMTGPARRLLAQTQRQLGDAAAASATLSGLGEHERDAAMAKTALAHAHLADGDAQAAADALAPVLEDSAHTLPLLLIEALLLDASARDRLGDTKAAESDVERALELAEPNRLIWPFAVTPARHLLELHPAHRTAHGGLLKDILNVLAGAPPLAQPREPATLRENLSDSELRVLRYLPSNLSAPEIGNELILSLHTVKTHMRNIYAKLGVHRRAEAVERARELGLLAPSSRPR